MSFWTDGKLEPKRQNRWVVHFDGVHAGNMYFATKVARPSVEVSNKEHKFLNHTFNYPGRATWKPITLTMVDVAGNGADPAATDGSLRNVFKILQTSGYVVPQSAQDGANLGTIAKSKAVTALSSKANANNANGITIRMVDADGNTVEHWTLKNAFITKFTPSELSYEDDGIATVDIEITYDYCEFKTNETDPNILFKAGPSTL
jgi:hypothetical protein